MQSSCLQCILNTPLLSTKVNDEGNRGRLKESFNKYHIETKASFSEAPSTYK